MSWQAALALAIPALVAIAGYGLTYRNNLQLAARKDRLDRVTRQLSDFYGPLLALASANRASWIAFRGRYRPDIPGYWDVPLPTPEEAAAWRLWVTEVFTPINRQMRDVVVNRADLLEEDDVPPVLLELCAHVSAYEPVLRRWEQQDFTEHVALLNFPDDALLKYLSGSFRRLKTEQNRLLADQPSSASPQGARAGAAS